MIAKLVGYKTVDFKNDRGEQIQGVNLYIVRNPAKHEAETVVGSVSEKIWISSVNDVLGDGLTVGKTYNFVYDTADGKKAFLADILPYEQPKQ